MSLVSIIIPVCSRHNRKETLGVCLESIRSQTYPRENIELVIVGDGCNPAAHISAADIQAKTYLFRNRAGLVKTRNKGVELSSGEFLAFIDADCVADKDWLRNLVAFLDNDGIAGCAGAVLDFNKRCINKNRIYGNEYYLPFTGFGNAVFHRKILEEIGFLDEALGMHEEDVDCSWRVYLKGYRIAYVPDAIVFHKNAKNSRDFFLSGVGIGNLSVKYKKILKISILPELARHFKKSDEVHSRFSLRKVVYVAVLISGCLYALLKQKLSFFSGLRPVELSDKFLQPAASIRPLAVEVGGQSLFKPNHILWWPAEDGQRIVNLRKQKHYELEGISAKIWEYVIDRMSEEEILNLLAEEYEVEPEELRRDIKFFIGALFREEILALGSGSGAKEDSGVKCCQA